MIHTLLKMVISNGQLISMPHALTCRIVSSFSSCREKKWDTRRVILKFSKIPSDLRHLGVWMLSTRHLNVIYPNFHKKSESTFPDSVPSVLTDLVGTDASQNGSLGLQDWLGLSSLTTPLNYTTVSAKSSQLHQGW